MPDSALPYRVYACGSTPTVGPHQKEFATLPRHFPLAVALIALLLPHGATAQTQLANGAVTLTAGAPSAITGTAVEGVVITFTPTAKMDQDSDIFTMTSSPTLAIKAAPSPTPVPIPALDCVVSQTTPGAFTHTTACEITDGREFRVLFIDAATMIPLSEVSANLVTVTLNSAGSMAVFEDHLVASTVVTFGMQTTKDVTPLTPVSGWTTLATAAGSDPVAISGGVARKFSLPPGKLVPLLVAPDMSLHGATFDGMGPWEQWFGRMVIFSGQGDRWLQISIKKDIMKLNHSLSARDAFETLDVVAGYGDVDNPQPRTSTVVSDRNSDLPLGFLGLKVTFWAINRGHKVPAVTIGRAKRECADVVGEFVHFFICSTPAKEYFSWNRELAIQFAHLDVAIFEITSTSKVDGLLPQLWGIKPLTEENAKYLDEDVDDAATANASENPLPATAGWAGSAAPKDLQMIVAEAKGERITV